MFGVTGLRLHLLMTEGQSAGPAWVNRRFTLWVMAWIAGHLLGAAALGGLVAWSGGFLPRLQSHEGALLCLLCIAGAAHQFGLISLPLTILHRQVNRTWMNRFPWTVVALGYGLQLGAGIFTRINVATFYVTLGCALLSGSPIAGALIMSLFGVSRALPAVLFARRAAEPNDALALAITFDGYEPLVQRWNGVGLALGAVFWTCIQLTSLNS